MKSQIYLFLIVFQIIISIVNSNLLNNIIELANHQFVYSHISFNSNGDMIID